MELQNGITVQINCQKNYQLLVHYSKTTDYLKGGCQRGTIFTEVQSHKKEILWTLYDFHSAEIPLIFTSAHNILRELY